MATVLTLAGAFGLSASVPAQLCGKITAGNTVVPVDYDNIGIFDANVDDGAAELDTAISSTSGEKIVFAHSLGAAAATRWLHDYGPASAADPADLSFVLIGNPLRRHGGFVPALYDFAAGAEVTEIVVAALSALGDWLLVEPTLPPIDTPYTVTDIVRQYDGFGDWPQNSLSLPALSNAIYGMQWMHPFYETVDPDDPHNAVYTEGNIAYVWNPSRLLFEYTRPEIEAAYSRPVAIPAPPPIIGADPPPPPPKPPLPELDPLNRKLLNGATPQEQADAAEKLARLKERNDQTWIVTVHDKLWRPVGELGDDLIELTGSDPRNNLPSATLKYKGGSPLVSTFMTCRNTMVGVTVETGGLRFAYYVKSHDYNFENGQLTCVANLVGVWDILNYLVIFPSWVLPVQSQPFSHAVFVWALCTTIENMVTECALRIQLGINEFIDNAASLNPDVRAWFGSMLQSNGNIFSMLKTPMYVVRTNPFLDTSPLIVRTVRMETCGAVIKDITAPYGVDVRVDLWLPGDAQPDQWTATIPFMALDQPTYVVTVKDRSQIEGPTKTVLDSVIRTVVDVEGSLLGKTLDPILNPRGAYSPEGVFIAPLIGVDFVEPWTVLVVPDPGEKGSVVTARISDHTQDGWQHIVGGRSPKWLVCAPPGDRGGADQPSRNSERSDERHVRVAHRLHLHSDRLLRHPLESAGRFPQQRFPGVPTHRALRPARRSRPLPSGDRTDTPDVVGAVQRGDGLRVRQRPVGQPRLHLGSSHVPQRRGVHPRQRRVPRRADVGALPRPQKTVHRLRGEHPVQAHRHRTRCHGADRRRQERRAAAGEKPEKPVRAARGGQRLDARAAIMRSSNAN